MFVYHPCPLHAPYAPLTCPYMPLTHPLHAPYLPLTCPYVPLHAPYMPLTCPLRAPDMPLMRPLRAPYMRPLPTEKATAADGTHPTGMHSGFLYQYFVSQIVSFEIMLCRD